MKIDKSKSEHKIVTIIAMIFLICLLVLLLMSLLKKEKTIQTKTIICTYEDAGELDELESRITIKYKEGKKSHLSFYTTYTYTENELLMSYKFEEERVNIETINKIKGVTSSISEDQEAEIVTIKGTIDFTNLEIPKDIDLVNPYSEFIHNNKIEDYLTSEGYTCK